VINKLSLNVEKIREDFPIFKNNPDLVYLDNAATTHKPIQVIDAVREFYTMYNANIHRGVYRLSVKATELYEEAHTKIAKFIGANSWDEVVFTKNATDAINMIAYALGFTFLEPGDEIVITIMEHHSNMLPWIRIAEIRKAMVKFVEVNSNGILNYEQLTEFVNKKTKIVSVTHVSNVLGTINNLQRASKIVRQNSEAMLIVDGAQSVPHLPINVRELDIDFLVFSGHKMLGPTGIGVLWGKRDLLEKMLPAIYGGDMVEKVEIIVKNGTIVYKQINYNILPWKFEAGTPNIAAGIGLAKAVEYLENIGMQNIETHEKELTKYAIKRLNEELEGCIKILGPQDLDIRGGIVSFTMKGLDPHVIATLLSMNNVAIRAGFHCAQPLHMFLGLSKGSARASFYIYNDYRDIDAFVNELKKLRSLAK